MGTMESPTLDIGNLAGKAASFQRRTGAIQASLPAPGFEWYPYDSLGNFFVLADLLTGERRFLLDLIGDAPLLDVGCGDGHIPFFLQSLRFKSKTPHKSTTKFNQLKSGPALEA